jgi:hypothetical protein
MTKACRKGMVEFLFSTLSIPLSAPVQYCEPRILYSFVETLFKPTGCQCALLLSWIGLSKINVCSCQVKMRPGENFLV